MDKFTQDDVGKRINIIIRRLDNRRSAFRIVARVIKQVDHSGVAYVMAFNSLWEVRKHITYQSYGDPVYHAIRIYE